MSEILSRLRDFFLERDPRDYQITVLASLFLYGFFFLGFSIPPAQAAVTVLSALFTQWACARLWRLPVYEPRSALISSISLCLLLRTNSLTLAALTSTLAVSSKFLIRWRGKHVFNPTNGAIIAMILLTGGAVWVAPGQWGNTAFFAFLMASAGIFVVNRSYRSDVTIALLVFWAMFLGGRALSLGDPLTIPFHQFSNGALVLFAFFMISDPKTTPDSRAGRILFAFLVALGAWYWHFRLFRQSGLLWSLAFWSLFVPVIDWLLPGGRYEWKSGAGRKTARPKGASDELEEMVPRPGLYPRPVPGGV